MVLCVHFMSHSSTLSPVQDGCDDVGQLPRLVFFVPETSDLADTKAQGSVHIDAVRPELVPQLHCLYARVARNDLVAVRALWEVLSVSAQTWERLLCGTRRTWRERS